MFPTIPPGLPDGIVVRTFYCAQPGCSVPHKMAVFADGPDDPMVIDRCRNLAAMSGWFIDRDEQIWCPEHRRSLC